MNLAGLAIERRAVTYFFLFLIATGGSLSFFQLGWLEDPEFTVKTAAITIPYPGATAEEVELEVVDLIETKLQEMVELDNIYSYSHPGYAVIKVDILARYWADVLPQVWDVLRRKIRDVEDQLPPGAGPVMVADDFGFVLGFLLAITGEGFSYAELEEYAKELRKSMSVVPGVARVDLWGVRDKRIYVDVSQAQLSALGITTAALRRTLSVQNQVVDGGRVDVQTQRFRVAPSGAFTSPEEIGELVFRGDSALASPGGDADQAQAKISPTELLGTTGEIIQLRDFASVSPGYAEPPSHVMRLDGRPSIALAAAPMSGANVVAVGQVLDEQIAEVVSHFPIGIEVHKISWQSDLVSESINGFMINLIQAIAIVLIVLAVTMGVRMGMIIGLSGLVLAILGTFLVMAVAGIDLQRISLGALVIAMGMMVDNAIVVADGIAVRMQQGMDRKQAAIESAGQPAVPLLGATLVASMAFYPIFASPESTGEYARSLFQVVAISLLFSWLLSQVATPLMCMQLLPEPEQTAEGSDPYGGRFYQRFRGQLRRAITHRVPFLGGMVALLFASVWGFGFVPQQFFPDASRHQFMIDYWLPEGTRIDDTSEGLKVVERELMAQPQVTKVATFVGKGPPRFYLPVDPEMSYPSYGQLVANTESLASVEEAIEYIEPWLLENASQALTRVRKYGVGSWDDWPFEARFSGPWNADTEVLRGLAAQGAAILEESPLAKEVRTNWRQRTRKLVPEYSQERGRWSNVTRADIASATRRAFDGIQVGLYREKDDLIPIVVRSIEDERVAAAATLDQLQVIPALSTHAVPMATVTRGIGVRWEDATIHRWNRRRAITVQCSPRNVTFPQLRAAVVEKFEAIELPPGYRLEWDGEYKTSRDSQRGLIPGLVPGLVIMVFIIVVLFNAFRPPLIIFAVIPFAVIGISLGLLVTQIPFGFMSLLGAMSLSGMMIKNSVVLLDQVNLNLAERMTPYDAVVEAAVSRLRPVLNAAATTVFGMAPLLQDVFWRSMAITIMAGLAFGTLVVMVMVPVLYATFYRISPPQPEAPGSA
ncbi:MAG: efflux RND transporter permease subunit [Myxococcota bacterium]